MKEVGHHLDVLRLELDFSEYDDIIQDDSYVECRGEYDVMEVPRPGYDRPVQAQIPR